jgi:hypothetical protein
MRLKGTLFASLTALLLGSCGTSGPAISAGGCEWAKPVFVSRQDVLTDGTARQILAHNEAWERVCAPAGR